MWPFIPEIIIHVGALLAMNGYLIEGSVRGSIPVHLSQEPTDTVWVHALHDPSKVRIEEETLVFTPDNYATTQYLKLSAGPLDDGIDSTGIDSTWVKWIIQSDDTTYAKQQPPAVLVKIFDYAFDIETLTTDVSAEFHYNEFSEAELLGLRDTLIYWLFGSYSLPSAGVDSVYVDMTYNTYMNPVGMDSLLQVDKLIIERANGFDHNIYHLIPTTRNNKLMICSYGHGDAYDINGVPLGLEYWVTRGYDVITAHQVARGENDSPLSHLVEWQRHDSLQHYESESFNPISMFADFYIRAINHLDSAYNYDNIYMCGISGGGYQTVLVGAIDARIEKTFEIAGTYPIFVRQDSKTLPGTVGDYEQGASATRSTAFVRDFFADKVGYLDMYMLCGLDREHWQLLNRTDDCCFEGVYWKLYVPEVKRRFQILSSGSFTFYQYEAGTHTITTEVLDVINSRL